MSYYSPSIEKLIESFAKLPSIGNKTAARLAFHMLNASEQETQDFINSILNAKKNLKYCSKCFNITDTDPCPICGNEKRNGYRGGNFYSWGSLLLLFRPMFVQQHSWREKRQPGKVRTALPPAIWNRKAGGEKIPFKPERYVYDRIAWAVDRSGD